MRTNLTFATLAAAALLASGCGTPGSYTQQHSTMGAVIGAGAGTLIGAAYGRPAEGAIAGALIGGAAGTVSGQSLDMQAAAQAQYQYQAAQASQSDIIANPPLTKYEVINMAKADVGDSVIISKINASRYVFAPTSQDIIDMKNQGVSDQVISALIVRAQQGAAVPQIAAVTPATTVAVPATTVYVDPVPVSYVHFWWSPPAPWVPGPPPPPAPGPPPPKPWPGPAPGPKPGPPPPGPGPRPPSPPR